MGKTLYKVNSDLVLHDDSEPMVLWDTNQGWEAKVSSVMVEFLSLFSVPRTKEGALKVASSKFSLSIEDMEQLLDQMIQKQMIQIFEPTGLKTVHGKGGMFDAPILPLSDCLSGDITDVLFLGMPYDVGVSHRPGCRFAPNYLRKTGRAIFQYKTSSTGEPVGSWEPIANQKIMEGIRLSDCGNLEVTVCTRNGNEFDMLQNTVKHIVKKDVFPVILGGDHSISLPVIKGLTAVYDQIGVIQFDAHFDFKEARQDGWREKCHHGNFMDWVVGDPKVERVFQIGIRQIVNEPVVHEKITTYPGLSLLDNLDDTIKQFPKGIPYHVTFDVDCLDPSILSSTGTPLPRGFSHEHVIAVLEKIFTHLHVISMDVVELIPNTTDREGLIVSDILLRSLSKWADQRHIRIGGA